MELSFKQAHVNRLPAVWPLMLIALLTVAHVLAVAHGVLTIDMARDLFWAVEIAQGRAYPLFGPPVGSFEVLGPVWYYVAAGAAAAAPSMTAYFALLGTLAATKYLLIYRVGGRWINPAFALALVAASGLPGIASYQLVGVGHPQMLETAIWACALCALRLREQPTRRIDAMGIGLFAALSLHAHPTALLLLPWAALAVLSLPGEYRFRAVLFSLLGAVAVFLPRALLWLAPQLAASAGPENVPAVSGLGGSVDGVVALAKNLLWYQPRYVMQTVFAFDSMMLSAWRVFWFLLLLATAIGAVLAALDRDLRRTLVAALTTLLAVLLAVALLRNHTPFYMLYVALPPLCVSCALSWYALRYLRGGTVASILVVASVVIVFVMETAAAVVVSRSGIVVSHLPLHSNMQNTATSAHRESVHSVSARDSVANWLCGRTGAISLHGDLAVAIDVGLGLDFFFACPRGHHPDVRVGGGSAAYVGMPRAAWDALTLRPDLQFGGFGLSRVDRIISPETALQRVSGRVYPPRLDLMIAGARRVEWQSSFSAQNTDAVIVSSLLPTSPLFGASAVAGDRPQVPTAQFANTVLFLCADCASGQVKWSLSIRGGLPETTSISVIDTRRPGASPQ